MADLARSPVTLPATAPGWLEQIQIRPLTAEELPALEWEGAFAHFRRVYDQAFARARRGNGLIWVAGQENGRLLGQIFVLLCSVYDPALADGRRQALIHSFRVRPELRGAGLGTRLLAHTEGDLARRGFQRVILNVARANPAAIRLYERNGYRKVGKDEGRWSYLDHQGIERHVHEPGWRMCKDFLNQG